MQKSPSDNPYATLDENYFIPEWPVGRLPGGTDSDAGLLLDELRRVIAYHADQNEIPSKFPRNFIYKVTKNF